MQIKNTNYQISQPEFSGKILIQKRFNCGKKQGGISHRYLFIKQK